MYYKDLLISGGTILTGNPEAPLAGSMIISENRIACIGSSDEVNCHPGAAGALKIDLEGNTLIPGLTDSHLHLASVAKQMEALSLNEASSLKEMLEIIREKASRLNPGEWIYGVRFDDSSWPEKRLPTRQDLDGLNLDNPVVLVRVCAHIHVANSLALKKVGLPANIDVLYEDQASKITEQMQLQMYNPSRMKDALHRTCLKMASQGLTCVHTCGCTSYGLEEDMDIYRKLKEEEKLPLRVIYYTDDLPEPGLESGDGDDWIRYGGYKMFLDGSLGGRTAALTLPYEDQPGNMGVLNHTAEEVRERMLEMHSRNIQVQVHAIGDAAIDQFIEGLGYAYAHGPQSTSNLRHRIVHVQICRPGQMEALKKLQAICDIQPGFVPSDISIAGQRLGMEREPWAYAWKDLIKAGLLLTGSSDAPVESTDPFRGIWAALNRTDETGSPEGGWKPDQKLTLEETLPLFTSNPWKAIGLSSRFGMLKKGYAADLVILDRDITAAPPHTLRYVKPLLTMVGGTVSYGKLEGWPSIL